MKRLVPKFTVRLLALAIALAFPLGGAVAQSACSTIATGAVLTAAQWNACFSAKQNSLGFTPLNKAGDFMTGKLTTLGSTTAIAGFNLPHGAAPLSPTNGDVWTTTAGLYARINGGTVGPYVSSGTAPVSSVFGRSGAVVAVTNDYSFAQISGSVAATQLPNPSATTLGGVKSLAAVSNQFLTSIGTNGTPTQAQPSAANLSNGTIGSGAVVLATSPTLTTPVIASIVNTGTVTLPTATDTLVGRATTDTLTNKTLTSPVLNTPAFSANAVPNTALAQMPTNSIKGNNTGVTANAADLTATQVATILSGVGGILNSKAVNFGYTLSTATGTQAVTGIGFQPTSVIVFGAAAGIGSPSSFVSFGISDSAKANFAMAGGVTAAGTFQTLGTTAVRFYTDTGATNFASATVQSYDADGFTLSWTKTGSPTGTASIIALCFR